MSPAALTFQKSPDNAMDMDAVDTKTGSSISGDDDGCDNGRMVPIKNQLFSVENI